MTPSEGVQPLTLGLGELLGAQAAKRSEQPFQSFGDGPTSTYAEVDERVATMRRFLDVRQVAPGDAVALC